MWRLLRELLVVLLMSPTFLTKLPKLGRCVVGRLPSAAGSGRAESAPSPNGLFDLGGTDQAASERNLAKLPQQSACWCMDEPVAER